MFSTWQIIGNAKNVLKIDNKKLSDDNLHVFKILFSNDIVLRKIVLAPRFIMKSDV